MIGETITQADSYVVPAWTWSKDDRVERRFPPKTPGRVIDTIRDHTGRVHYYRLETVAFDDRWTCTVPASWVAVAGY